MEIKEKIDDEIKENKLNSPYRFNVKVIISREKRQNKKSFFLFIELFSYLFQTPTLFNRILRNIFMSKIKKVI